MNKILFLVSATLIFSCQNSSTDLINPESLAANPYIASYGFESLSGTIEFKASQNENLVFFNLGKENQRLFYLQTQNLVQFTNTIGDGEIFVDPNKNMIIVNSNSTNEIVIFSLEDNQIPLGIFGNRSVRTLKGFGIGEASGDAILELFKMDDLFSIFGPEQSARATGTCDDGGPGSSYCSVIHGGNSCSVSCNSGYYACCNETTQFPYVSCSCSTDGDPEQRISLISSQQLH